MAENPPRGAVVDYVLAAVAPGPVTLEILDAKGELVAAGPATKSPARPISPASSSPPTG